MEGPGAENWDSQDCFPKAGSACLWVPIPHDPQTDVFPNRPNPHFLFFIFAIQLLSRV